MIVRRMLLVVMVLVFPAVATAGLYYLSLQLLEMTGRIVADPLMLRYITIGEFIFFTFGALMEARSRWSTSPSG